ncbi:MAG: hypothetical protein ABIO46_00670 [Chitinophagales bacterium]
MKPVILIPGIQATALVNANTFDFSSVWNAYDSIGTVLFTKVTGPYISDRLQLDPLYDENMNSLIERNHMAQLPYERTIINLAAKLVEAGDRSPIYLFGYDWRLSNAENGKRLYDFTQYIKKKLSVNKGDPCEGFRFLTHSMGGLIFSCYLTQLKGKYDDIDKAVISAPPFRGSPYALVHMIKGDGGFKSFLNSLFGRNEDIRKVVRTYPSIFELLPWYDQSVIFEDNRKEVDLTQASQWQSNISDDIPELFKARLKELADFRKNKLFPLHKLPEELRTRMIVLAGSGDDTVTQLQVRKEQDKISNFVIIDDKRSVRMDTGDGTVPLPSSTIFKDSVKTLVVFKTGLLSEPTDNLDYHGLFLRDSRVQNILQRFFTMNVLSAKVKAGELTTLRGPNPNWWKSIGDTVVNASPF